MINKKSTIIITLIFAVTVSAYVGVRSYAQDNKSVQNSISGQPAQTTTLPEATTADGDETAGSPAESVAEEEPTSSNPYYSIVRRNAFGLKEKPVKKAPEKKEEEAEVAPDDLGLVINGFSSIGKKKFVYFKMADEENKGRFKYYTVDIDDTKANPIDVVKVEDKSIDIRYKGRSYSLNYQDHKNKLTRVAKSNSKSKSGSKTIPGRNINNKGSSSRTKPNTGRTYGSNNVINRYGANSSLANTSRGADSRNRASLNSSSGALSRGSTLRRSVRTVNAGGGGPSGMTSEEQAVLMEVNRAMNQQQGIPMPPTPGIPSTTRQAGGN